MKLKLAKNHAFLEIISELFVTSLRKTD